MDPVVNENGFFHMANYNFDKPIKISFIFEDNDSDETETVENSQLQENQEPRQYSPPQNNNHINSANEPLNKTTLLDHSSYSHVSFDDMEHRLNIDNDRSTNAEENCSRGVKNQQPVNSYAMSKPQIPLEEMRNVDNMMLDYNYLLNNENTQYSYLLDTVSENLIMILKYYRFFSMNYAKNCKARENYLNHKIHYYNQSYNAVVAVFLPQEHNHMFIRNFIKRTVDIANRKQQHHNMTLINSLEILLKDLIQWAKQRKYMETRNNQLNRQPLPPYSVASGNTQQMNTQTAVSLGQCPPITSATYGVSNTYTRPMTGPSISSNSAVQPPSYSASSISTQQPISRPTSSIPTTVSHLPPASNSFSNVNPEQPHCRHSRPVSLAPSDLPLPQSSSHNNSNINPQKPMRRPPSITLAKSDPSLTPGLNSFSSVNTQQLQSTLPPVSIIPSILPVPRSSQNNYNVDRRHPTNLPPPVSLIPSILPEPTTIYSISNVDTPQTTTKTSVSVVREPLPPASNNITNSNTNERIPADQDNTICLFSTGSPGSEISISIDAEIAKIVKDVNSSKKVTTALHNGASKRRKTETNDIESPNMMCTRTWIPSMQKQFQQNNHNCDSSKQPPFAPNSDSVDKLIEPCNYNHFNQLNPGRRQNDKEYDSNKCQPIISRSESRDSGFGSPVLSTLLTTNDNNKVYPQYTDNRDFTPEITHVTSMHPDAIFIASGMCKICGATTKNKCIACYKEYYCGSKCQTVDWPYHMKVCCIPR